MAVTNSPRCPGAGRGGSCCRPRCMWGLTSDRPAVYLVWTQSAPPAPTASISKHERWDEALRPIQAPQAKDRERSVRAHADERMCHNPSRTRQRPTRCTRVRRSAGVTASSEPNHVRRGRLGRWRCSPTPMCGRQISSVIVPRLPPGSEPDFHHATAPIGGVAGPLADRGCMESCADVQDRPPQCK